MTSSPCVVGEDNRHSIPLSLILHKLLRKCEDDLREASTISKYALIRKKQFMRSLEVTSVRIGRFLALYRSFKGDNPDFGITQAALQISAPQISALRATLAIFQSWNISDTESNIGIEEEKDDVMEPVLRKRKYDDLVIPYGIDVKAISRERIRIYSNHPRYEVVIAMKDRPRLKKLIMSNIKVSEHLVKLIANRIDGICQNFASDMLVNIHTVMKSIANTAFLAKAVSMFLKFQDFFQFVVKKTDSKVYLYFQKIGSDFLLESNNDVLYVLPHVSGLITHWQLADLSEESVLNVLNQMKTSMISKKLTDMFSLLSRDMTNFSLDADSIKINLAGREIGSIRYAYDTGNYVCDSKWCTEIERFLNDFDIYAIRNYFDKCRLSICSKAAGMELSEDDFIYVDSEEALQTCFEDYKMDIRMIYMRRIEKKIAEIAQSLQIHSVQYTWSKNVLILNISGIDHVEFKLRRGEWVLVLSDSFFVQYSGRKILKIRGKTTYRFEKVLAHILNELSIYISSLKELQAVCSSTSAELIMDNAMCFIMYIPGVLRFFLRMRGIKEVGYNDFVIENEIPEVDLVDFMSNLPTRSHFLATRQIGHYHNWLGPFVQASLVPLMKFRSIFDCDCRNSITWMSNTLILFLQKEYSLVVSYVGSGRFKIIIPPFGLSATLIIPLAIFSNSILGKVVRGQIKGANIALKVEAGDLQNVMNSITSFLTEKAWLIDMGFSIRKFGPTKSDLITRTLTVARNIQIEGVLSSTGVCLRILNHTDDPVAKFCKSIFELPQKNREKRLKIYKFVMDMLNPNLQIGCICLSALYSLSESRRLSRRIQWNKSLETGSVDFHRREIKFILWMQYAGSCSLTLTPDPSDDSDALVSIGGIPAPALRNVTKMRRDLLPWLEKHIPGCSEGDSDSDFFLL